VVKNALTKGGFIRVCYQEKAGGTLYHLLNMGVNRKNRDPSFCERVLESVVREW